MTLMVGCGVLVALGLLLTLRWGGLRPGAEAGPEADWAGNAAAGNAGEVEAPPIGRAVRRYVDSVAVAVVAGLGAGLLVAGPGGRLAMRLLAATAGDGAQGRVTEAEEVVGEITVAGTIGLVIFVALFAGATTGALFMVLRRWLPAGRPGGLAFGLTLLVVGATRIEPLRRDNPDFDLVGPGPLALFVFAAVVVLHGCLVAALANRYRRVVDRATTPKARAAVYLPLALLAPVFVVLLGVVVVGGLVVGLGRVGPLARAMARPAARTAGRWVLVGAVAVALPGFVASVVDIAGRGPG